MIGASILVIGLLLVVTSLVSTRVPADAVFAAPGPALDGRPQEPGLAGMARRARTPLRAFLLSPIHGATWNANLAIFYGFWIAFISFTAIVGVFSAGAGLLAVGIGVILVAVGIEMCRGFARIERRRAMLADPRPLEPHRYKPLAGDVRQLLVAEFADEARWRDVVYVVINFPLAMLEMTAVAVMWGLALSLISSPLWFDALPVANVPSYVMPFFEHSLGSDIFRVAIGLAVLPFAASVSQGIMVLQRAVIAGLLCASEKHELQQRVQTLTQTRSAVLGVEASELRRIERDLHDGAQQRLVMLTIDLSLAGERIERDPEGARKLVEDAREQARQALAELRDLVRGIAPAILLDRGLAAALSSIAGRCSVPTVVQTNLAPGERLPEAIERAAYFVVAEALANVAKHSQATNCEIRCFREDYRLIVEVWDDGKGGAKLGGGSGLEGLDGRVAALDGRFFVSSPEGGPTVLRAELPAPPRQPVAPQPQRTYWAGAARPVEGWPVASQSPTGGWPAVYTQPVGTSAAPEAHDPGERTYQVPR